MRGERTPRSLSAIIYNHVLIKEGFSAAFHPRKKQKNLHYLHIG